MTSIFGRKIGHHIDNFSYTSSALKEQREKRRTEKAISRKSISSRAIRSAQIRTNWDPYRHKSSYTEPKPTVTASEQSMAQNVSSTESVSIKSEVSFTDRLKALSQQIETKKFSDKIKIERISVIQSTIRDCKCGCTYAYANEAIKNEMDQSEPSMHSPTYAASPSSGYDTNSESSVHSACDSSPTRVYTSSDYENDDIDVESI